MFIKIASRVVKRPVAAVAKVRSILLALWLLVGAVVPATSLAIDASSSKFPAANAEAKSAETTLPPGAVAVLEPRLPFHGTDIGFMRFSPNGKLLATANRLASNATINVWSTIDGTRIAHRQFLTSGQFPSHDRFVDIAFFDDDQLAIIGERELLQLWTLSTNELTKMTSNFQIRPSWSNGFADYGNTIVLDANESLTIHDFRSGKKIGEIAKGDPNAVNVLDVRGEWVAFSKFDTSKKTFSYHIWDLASEKELFLLSNIGENVRGLLLTPNHENIILFAGQGAPQRIVRWNLKKQTQTGTFPIDGDPQTLALSPDGKFLVAGAFPWKIFVFEVDTSRLLWQANGYRASDMGFAISSDGRTLAARGQHESLWLFNLHSGKSLLTGPQSPRAIFTGAQRQPFASLSPENTILALSGKAIGQFNYPERSGGEPFGLQTVVFSPDHRLAADSAEELGYYVVRDEIVVRDVATGRKLAHLSKGFNQRAVAGTMSGDAAWQAVALNDGTVKARHYRSKDVTLYGFDKPVNCLQLSAYGNHVVGGGADRVVRVWETDASSDGRELIGHERPVVAVAISPDDEWVASGSEDKTIRLWNLQNAPRNLRFECGETPTALTFDNDGGSLAAGMADGSIAVWKLANVGSAAPSKQSGPKSDEKPNKESAPVHLTGLPSAVTRLAYSHDGKMLAAGGRTGELRLWDMTTNDKPRDFAGDVMPITSIGFFNDGKWLVSGNDHGKAVVWAIEDGAIRNIVDGFASKEFDHFGCAILAITEDPSTHDLVGLTSSLHCCRCDLKKSEKVLMIADFDLLSSAYNVFNEFAFSPDGSRLAAMTDTSLYIWGIPRGDLQSRIPCGGMFAFSADSKRIVAFGRQVMTIDVESGKTLSRIPAPNTPTRDPFDRPFELAVCPVDDRFISVSSKSIDVWDAKTGRQIAREKFRGSGRCNTKFRPESRVFGVIADREKKLELRELPSMKIVAQFAPRSGKIFDFCFLDNGPYVTVLEDGGEATIWKLP